MDNVKAALRDYGAFCAVIWKPTGEVRSSDELATMGLGMLGEWGEAAEALAEGVPTCPRVRSRLKEKLGDTIYYWAGIVRAYGMDPGDCAEGALPEMLTRTLLPTPFVHLAASALRLTAACGRIAEAMKKGRRDDRLDEDLLRTSLRAALRHWGEVCQQCELDWRDVLTASKTKEIGRAQTCDMSGLRASA